MSSEPPSREKWEVWMEILGNEVYTLYMYRTFWRTFIRTAEDAGVTPGHIFDFFAGTYSTRQAVAIRRVCSGQRNAHSFRRLLSEIRDNPTLPRHVANSLKVAADIRSLDAGNLAAVQKYVNQRVAHRQEAPAAHVPTFADIHDAIDQLGRLHKRYMFLVHDVLQELEPLVQGGDVMDPFRKAWLQPYPEPRRPPPA